MQQLSQILSQDIEKGTFLKVKFDKFNDYVAVCVPNDEVILQKHGLLTLTTYELSILETSEATAKTLTNLLKIKNVLGGTIKDFTTIPNCEVTYDSNL